MRAIQFFKLEIRQYSLRKNGGDTMQEPNMDTRSFVECVGCSFCGLCGLSLTLGTGLSIVSGKDGKWW
ncbi:hypothetical protein BCR21_11975 [Enterococcus ureasiticus]|uniref:Uncharacterized protein n=1 Tax=Enterococcus ureasiticus TaxID=903984 RepID=A0A1E5GE62_9ENTE|nr:hypothetical protein BCR21_11975 [Enterococcus ureasiticus]